MGGRSESVQKTQNVSSVDNSNIAGQDSAMVADGNISILDNGAIQSSMLTARKALDEGGKMAYQVLDANGQATRSAMMLAASVANKAMTILPSVQAGAADSTAAAMNQTAGRRDLLTTVQQVAPWAIGGGLVFVMIRSRQK